MTATTRPTAILAALVLWAGTTLAQAPLGGPAPDFTLDANDGMTYTLSDGFGSTVQLLYFVGFS